MNKQNKFTSHAGDSVSLMSSLYVQPVCTTNICVCFVFKVVFVRKQHYTQTDALNKCVYNSVNI